MSLRNRELVNLVVVGVMTAIGFASVYIARQAVVSTASLSYAGFFFALYLAAHLVCRLTVPYADPYLLPMAALLTAIGVTEIYRLEPDRRVPPEPLDRGRARSARRDALPPAARLPAAWRATSTSSASARSRCSCSPLSR